MDTPLEPGPTYCLQCKQPIEFEPWEEVMPGLQTQVGWCICKQWNRSRRRVIENAS